MLDHPQFFDDINDLENKLQIFKDTFIGSAVDTALLEILLGVLLVLLDVIYLRGCL
jgi:hypothetical protein